MSTIRQAIQALVYGLDIDIQGVSVELSTEDELEEEIVTENLINKDEIVEMNDQALFDLNIIIQ